MQLFSQTNFSFAEIPTYDPKIHFYRDGMTSGVMYEHVTYGTIESLYGLHTDSGEADQASDRLVPFFKPIGVVIPELAESGSTFVPRSVSSDTGTNYDDSAVRLNSCGGGDDAWVDFYYINENYLWNGKLRTWASNPVTNYHITQHNGLDGGYYCVGGSCTISLCSTQIVGADPGSVKLLTKNN